jgi:S-DNA-T family DNA segregation ATPase FtsK/SpoIIIE
LKSQTKSAGGAASQPSNTSSLFSRILREGILLLTVAVCGYLGLTLLSYDPHDPGWSKTGTNSLISNSGGPAGAWLADVFFSLFGVMAFLFPLMLAYQTWCVLRDKRNLRDPLLVAVRTIGLCLVMVSGTGLAVQYAGDAPTSLPASVGGVLGISVAGAADSTFGVVGGALLLAASFLFGSFSAWREP